MLTSIIYITEDKELKELYLKYYRTPICLDKKYLGIYDCSDYIPSKTEYIEFYIENYDLSLLPKGLLYLETKKVFKSMLNNLPNNLECLKLGYGTDKPLNILPKSIKYLELLKNEEHDLTDLPEELIILKIGYYNGRIDKLPKSLKYLEIKNKFNRSIELLNNNITHLYLGDDFNQDIHHLPNNLKYLKFGKNFNKKIYNYPEGLKNIEFGENYNQEFIGTLPNTLLSITFGKNFNKSINTLPNFIKFINIGFKMLECENTFSNLLLVDDKIIKHEKGYYLFIGSNYVERIDKLPISLEKIMISKNYPYINMLPKEKIIFSI